AYACLATRVPVGMEITADLLDKVERAERVFLDQGFRDFRVRIIDRDTAKIQILEEEFFQLIEKKNRIIKEMGGLFEHILLDLEGRSERTN
ncbi:TIGR00268 family protein, partial [bacterium]|nr:TIGR00268 family protein [bacterium]